VNRGGKRRDGEERDGGWSHDLALKNVGC
jgi:hypothetical protein